ncbi:hypothetical protein D9615_008866 [Tricholomella constricta]|uniref:Uncharacterized protein n=1 Tax=Tricholomella constricta TaxID=117010 RepID=A0A8H5LYG2_9AGAR|nr:hypothetical protein D9615_008866 [Tricholomella constricta]
MPGIPLSGEICARIVQSLGPVTRRGVPGHLAALCRTCKAFQREAEVKLYDSLFFSDPARAHLACRTVSQNERLALLVRTFWFSYESRRPALPRQFWMGVQNALNQMSNLENLSIFDNTLANSWILDPTHIKFQLHDAKLRFTWDATLIQFLESQPKLQKLQTIDRSVDTDRLPLSPGSLLALNSFDGTLMVGMHMLSSPLTHLQMLLENEVLPQFMSLLPRLWNVHKTLRALSLLELPEELVPDTLSILSSTCPNLVHIGLFPLPPINRHDIHHSLMYMHHLKSIQLDIAAWSPQPNLAAQRALAAELMVFCPSIRHVVFWINSTRFRWHYVHEWLHHVDVQQHPQIDSTWTLF